MSEYGYVKIGSGGFPLQTVRLGADRKVAAEEANTAYRRAVNTGQCIGIRFGVLSREGAVRGKNAMTKSWRKYNGQPFA